MVKRLRVADPLPWLLLIGGLCASLLILPLSLFQSGSFSDARTSSYNEWICEQSSSPPRSTSKLLPDLSGIKCCMAKKGIKCADAICRVGFAHDLDMEMQQIQSEIDRMQSQLELFVNSSAVSSAYSRLHTSEAGHLVSPRTVNTHHIPAPESRLELQPFLFIGVLSVAGNAGDTQQHRPCLCIAAALCIYAHLHQCRHQLAHLGLSHVCYIPSALM